MKYEVELTDEQARDAREVLENRTTPFFPEEVMDVVAAKVLAAIRANPPKPPRMDEPGFGPEGFVRAGSRRNHTRRLFVRSNLAHSLWSDGLRSFEWKDLLDPEPWRAEWKDLLDPEPWRADA